MRAYGSGLVAVIHRLSQSTILGSAGLELAVALLRRALVFCVGEQLEGLGFRAEALGPLGPGLLQQREAKLTDMKLALAFLNKGYLR